MVVCDEMRKWCKMVVVGKHGKGCLGFRSLHNGMCVMIILMVVHG